MKHNDIIQHIVNWLKTYSDTSKTEGFVIGISGGIDSALTSTLCALTGKKSNLLKYAHPSNTKQNTTEETKHIEWLKKNYPNVSSAEVNLTSIFEEMEKHLR
jgi:NAD+ synthase